MRSFGLRPQDDKERPNGVILSEAKNLLSPISKKHLKMRSFATFRMARKGKLTEIFKQLSFSA
jgi:hypothetical protein